MKHYSFNGLTRISKQAARKLYNAGEAVHFCPCNLRPGYPYYPNIRMDNSDNSSFEKAVYAFEFYNCINSETGKYTAFYQED